MNSRSYTILAAIYVAACIVLGGASAAGIVANALLQLGAILIGGFSLPRLLRHGTDSRARMPLLICASIFALCLLQLVPLPPSVWTLLPGRAEYAADLAEIKVQAPWLGISLAPEATLASMLALLPAAAAFLAVLNLDEQNRRWVAVAIAAAAIVSVALSIIQVSTGAKSPLYLYEITNRGSAVGFFANRNHLTTLLLATIPLVEGIRTSGKPSTSISPPKPGIRIATYATIFFLVVGIVATGSRAGLAILFPTTLFTLALHRRLKTGMISKPIVWGAVLLSGLALAAVLLGPQGERIAAKTNNLNEDVRFYAAEPTFIAAIKHLPFGSGQGPFDSVYRDQAADDNLQPNFVNHAHDDYLETLLTAGIPGALILLFFLIWYGRAIDATWRQRPKLPGSIPRAATIVIAIILLHSALDYPLRTAAISVVFAVACAMLVPPSAALQRRNHPSGNRAPARMVTIE